MDSSGRTGQFNLRDNQSSPVFAATVNIAMAQASAGKKEFCENAHTSNKG
ncbi:hypothetical protein KOR42_32210 [Thalassoglobus neptunius]|uniref:Uncharacterized protein n=1 Tax=Thalassoglobus neptunius TaxID=1938619 RepID=A0A5C5WP70_9PLAN|nr:hypothetical protein KOR42_32210 [Thalassoglobus neptunius]